MGLPDGDTLIDDNSKNKILFCAMQRGAKDTSNGMSVNQAKSVDSEDSPGATDESDHLGKCDDVSDLREDKKKHTGQKN